MLLERVPWLLMRDSSSGLKLRAWNHFAVLFSWCQGSAKSVHTAWWTDRKKKGGEREIKPRDARKGKSLIQAKAGAKQHTRCQGQAFAGRPWGRGQRVFPLWIPPNNIPGVFFGAFKGGGAVFLIPKRHPKKTPCTLLKLRFVTLITFCDTDT